jgi:hypothetical protein
MIHLVQSEHLIQLRKRQFISQTQRHLGMLQHVRKREIFNLVIRRMNLCVRVFEVRLNHERGRIPVFACRSMVRARIAAFRQDVGDAAILSLVSDL